MSISREDKMFFYLIGKGDKPEGPGLAWLPDSITIYTCFFCGKRNTWSKDYCEKCDHESDMWEDVRTV